MAPLRGLLFTVLCCSVVIEVCCITVEEFYTFGENSGDSRLSRNDDGSSEVITLRTEFPFFDQIRRRVYVSTLLHYPANLPRIAVLFERSEGSRKPYDVEYAEIRKQSNNFV